MSSRTIPVRLRAEELRQVDALVELGIFDSRSRALRELIKLGIEGLDEVSEVASALRKLFELEKKEGSIPVKLPGALKQLLSERERFP
ncbi:MAG: ribbon-helix-helix domain-containing protein [Thermoproteota archaeon]